MEAAETARVLSALGHEGRLSIFRLLVDAGPQGLPAGEVARRTGQLQNTTSSNLGVLANVGLVTARRNGRSVIYAVAHTRFGEALQFLTQSLLEDRTGAHTSFLQGLLEACSAPPEPDRHNGRSHDAA